MPIKKSIPNLITLSNLFCGCIALVFVTRGDYYTAFIFVAVGIFLDFFDGFFARLLRVSSPLGLQLDSLADMVTSGVAPGLTMFMLLTRSNSGATELLPYLGFLITLGACYRLANFNIDERQTDSFIGLPTPANALLIMSLPLIVEEGAVPLIESLLKTPWFLIFLSIASAAIMNAEIPLFSLKIKKLNIKDNLLQFFFLFASLTLILFFHFLGVALAIVLYVLLSIFQNLLKR